MLQGLVAFQVGDEDEILPGKLQNEMLMSLNRHNNNNNVHSKDVCHGKTALICPLHG